MTTISPPPPADLLEVLEGIREVYVSGLRQHLGHQQTAGSCLYAAILLQTAVTHWLPHYRATIRGGDGHRQGGVFVEGQGHGHYWVEIGSDASTWIADVSGDQFGLPPVQLLPASHAKQQYRAGDQSTVDAHVEELRAEMRRAVQEEDAAGTGIESIAD